MAEKQIAEIRRVTYVGMAVNVAISIMKFAGGWFWHSQALIADAVHSLSDMVTDLAVVFGVKYWEAPADDEHPYGHGKIQALVTLFIGMMLILVAYELGKHAIFTLLAGGSSRPSTVAFVVALISIALKEWLFRWTDRVARRVKSPALAANARHHRSDALSSVPVAIAVAVAYVFPACRMADSVGALIVSGFILGVAWEIIHPALQELIDAVIDDKSLAVQRLAEQVPGVKEVHQCRARRYGGAFQADLHVMVDRSLSVVEAHDLSHHVENAIIAANLDVSDVVIHIEPVEEGRKEQEQEQNA